MLGLEYEEQHPFLPASPYYFYKIVCKDDSIKKCYVGKTKDLKSRTASHKCMAYFSDIKLYQVIRQHGGWDNWKLVLFHKCICDEPTSIYMEVTIIKQVKEEGYEMLNCQLPVNYPKQQYNKTKCQEHYAIKKECACGWFGSKMDWAHHQKSKRHRLFCINSYEKELNSVINKH